MRRREGQQVQTIRPNTQRHKMLQAFAAGHATDSEAATLVGLNRPGVCYWKRASELRQAGYIAPTGETRLDPDSGKARNVWTITVQGVWKLAALTQEATTNA